MSNVVWHRLISKDKNKIMDFLDYFEKEIEEAKKEIKISGLLVNVIDSLPSYHDVRYSQLQDVESVLEVLENEIKAKKTEKYKQFLEHYKRNLSSTDVNRYVEGDPDVVALYELVTEISYIRNKLFGIVKSLEMKHYGLGNVTKLQCAGMENVRIDL